MVTFRGAMQKPKGVRGITEIHRQLTKSEDLCVSVWRNYLRHGHGKERCWVGVKVVDALKRLSLGVGRSRQMGDMDR